MRQDYVRLARHFAVAHGINPDFFVRQIRQESGFNPNARSPAGAIGIAQIMPATAKGWGVDPTNPVAALNAAAAAMGKYVRQFGSYRDALVAYNAGPGAVGKPLPAETQNYIKVILGGGSGGGGGGTSIPGFSGTLQTANVSQQNVFNKAAFQDEQRKYALAQLLQRDRPQSSLLKILPQAPPSPQDFTQNVLKSSISGKRVNFGGGSANVDTSAKGVANFEGKQVAAWIAPILRAARQAGWKGSVSSGYRSVAEQRRIYNSGVRPAAKPGQSNHNFTGFPGGAVDVTDAPQLAAILNRLGIKKLKWAGAKDPVHFSHPHGGSY